MKKNNLIFIAILFPLLCLAQDKLKAKGNKIVTIQKHEYNDFTELEIEDNLEVFLLKGDSNALEIETDENLHIAINHKIYGNSLRLNTNKDITSFKKLEIKVFFSDSLKLISIKNNAKLNALNGIPLNNITIKSYDYSKCNIKAESSNFSLFANDKSKIELDLKSQDAFVELSKNSEMEGIINSKTLKLDMYQKSSTTLEGDIHDIKLRIDNDAYFNGKKLNSNLLLLTAESNTKCNIFSNGSVTINASGETEVFIYGKPKIQLENFADNATLYKKIIKP